MLTARRDVIAGLGAGIFVGIDDRAAQAAATTSLFANTPLATNLAAQYFRRVNAALPNVAVMTAAGPSRLSALRGKARLIALWAEWCTPCLNEIREFARLRPQVASDRFDIVLLLTGSEAKLDLTGAVAKLRPLGAASLPLMVEPNGGRRSWLGALREGETERANTRSAVKKDPPGLPIVWLIDSRGTIRGQSEGYHLRSTATTPPKGIWALPDGGQLLKALSGGLLDWL